MFKTIILVVASAICQRAISVPSTGCKIAKADIVFLLDTSTSVGMTNFKIQRDFVANVSRTFDIGRNKVQVGVVTFSSVPSEEFKLNANKNAAQLLAAIDKIKYRFGGTETDLALRYVRTKSFTQAEGDRRDVVNILIIMTDGKSRVPHQTAIEAALVLRQHIKVISVGIGMGTNIAELRALATTTKNVVSVQSFSALHGVFERVLNSACNIESGWRATSKPRRVTSSSSPSTTTPTTSPTTTTTPTTTTPTTTTTTTPTTTPTTTTTTTPTTPRTTTTTPTTPRTTTTTTTTPSTTQTPTRPKTPPSQITTPTPLKSATAVTTATQPSHVPGRNTHDKPSTQSTFIKSIVKTDSDETHMYVCIALGSVLAVVVLVNIITQHCAFNDKMKKRIKTVNPLNF